MIAYMKPIPQTRQDIVKYVLKNKKVDKMTLYHFVRFSDESYSFMRKQERKRKAFEQSSVLFWTQYEKTGEII